MSSIDPTYPSARHALPNTHRRASDPSDAEYGHARNLDIDKIARYGLIWDRYVKLVIPVIWGFIIWFATKLYPAVMAYPAVVQRLDDADKDRATMTISINILTRIQCLQLDAVDRAKINLDCSEIPLPAKHTK